MALTVKEVLNAKPLDKAYKLADANGLYLFVSATGSKSWRCNYVRLTKQATQTFGLFPKVSLAEARLAHAKFKDGEKVETETPDFATVAEKFLRIKLPKLSNPKHQIQFAATLSRFAYPSIGQVPVSEITRSMLVELVQAIESKGISETAYRVSGRIEMVLDYAVDAGLIQSHPAAKLTRVLAPRKRKQEMASIPPTKEEVHKLLQAITSYEEPLLRITLLLMAHTFVRVGELVGWKKSEIIYADSVWIIPQARMKARIPHVVPLSPQVLALLKELEKFNAGSEYVLQSPQKPNKHINESTPLDVLYKLGYRKKMTAHGFRALASTILNQQSAFKADVIERQLAHKETNEVRAAYNRAEYLPQRRELMTWWSNWLDSAAVS
jgi:integrase